MTSPSDCSHLTLQGHSPYGRPARETLLGGEWRVLSLRALPPRYSAGGQLSFSRPRSLGSTWREQLAFEKAAWVYSLYGPVYTVYTLYKLLTVHPTGLNFCTLCTFQLSAVSLQLSAFSLQPSAFSLSPSAFSLSPSAFSLQPTVWSTNQSRASRFMLCSDWSNR
jgi:hypothetical protein